MTSVRLLFIGLLCFCASSKAQNELDVGLGKSLFIRQFLAEIDWRIETTQQKQFNEFRLCTFRDSVNYHYFSKHLNKLRVEVQGKALRISNFTQERQLSRCHAIFLSDDSQKVFNWENAESTVAKALIIVEGQNQVGKGAHIGLFLNQQQTFNYELNPDRFIQSIFVPSPALLQYAQLSKSKIAAKIELLRQLVNFTEWPESALPFSAEKPFVLCTFKQPVLNEFLGHFIGNKTIQGGSVKNQAVDNIDEIKGCDTVFIGNDYSQTLIKALINRAEMKALLVGNAPQLGEKGVHYNLEPTQSTSSQRFEINLMAFAQTGHTPRFELLNSAVLIEKDYPELAKTLNQIIQQTRWPKKGKVSEEQAKITVCLSQQDELLQSFLQKSTENALLEKTLKTKIKKINFSQLSMKQRNGQCDVVVLNALTKESSLQNMALENVKDKLLVVSSYEKNIKAPFHYRVFLSPRKIELEFDLDFLNASGFLPSETLLQLGKAIQRRGDD